MAVPPLFFWCKGYFRPLCGVRGTSKVRWDTSDGQRIGVAMPEVKPSISELYESGGLDMWLVNKIAHNELDKSKGPSSILFMHSPRNISMPISMTILR